MNDCLDICLSGAHTLGSTASTTGTHCKLNPSYCDMPADGEYALAGSQNDWSFVAFDVFTVSIVDAAVAAVVPTTIGMISVHIMTLY